MLGLPSDQRSTISRQGAEHPVEGTIALYTDHRWKYKAFGTGEYPALAESPGMLISLSNLRSIGRNAKKYAAAHRAGKIVIKIDK
jgi:hypothetical protein